MPRRRATLAAIAAIFAAAVAFASTFGPSRRVRPAPPAVVSVAGPAELLEALVRSGARGRLAVVFTRYLNAIETPESPGPAAVVDAGERGVFRRVSHYPPDGAWPGIERTLAGRKGMRPTGTGFTWIASDVRVDIAPLARFAPPGEEAIVVIEPRAWSAGELDALAGRIASRALPADLVVIVRGTDADADRFRAALSAGRAPGRG
jgi:hypothetical protein